MPSYLAGAARVSLAHADLQRTLTANPIKGVGTEVRANLQKIDDEFAHHAIRLQEAPIHSMEEGLALRCFGEDEDMPFYLMKAGESLYPQQYPLQQSIEADPSIEKLQAATRSHLTLNGTATFTSNQNPNSPSLMRRAISLQITLKPEAFLLQPQCTVRKGKRPVRQDLKIDIFFNGSRCTCAYLAARGLTASEPNRKFDETFHGQRNGMSTEQPWIMVPAGQDAEGGLRENRRSKGGASDLRWEAINKLLLSEACAFDKDAQGKSTVLGEYLQSLSRIQLPEEMKALNGPKQYGVIDVVITTGFGRKDDSSNKYLLTPRGARLGRVDWSTPILKVETPSTNQTIFTPTLSASQPSPTTAPNSIPIPPDSLSSTTTITPSNRPKRKQPSAPPLPLLQPDATPTPNDDSPSVTKRARLKGPGPITAPSTLNPNPTKINRLTTIRLPGSQLKAFQNIKPKPTPPPVLKPIHKRPRQKVQGRAAATPSSKTSKVTEDTTKNVTEVDGTPTIYTPHEVTQNGSGSGGGSGSGSSVLTALDAKINEDCVIAFDPTGVRQVRKERGLWFKESGVLMGVRYVVVPT